MTQNKNLLKQGLSFFLYALPLLFGGPVVITIGFKALKKDGDFLFLALGIFLALGAIVLLTMAVNKLVAHFFNQ